MEIVMKKQNEKACPNYRLVVEIGCLGDGVVVLETGWWSWRRGGGPGDGVVGGGPRDGVVGGGPRDGVVGGGPLDGVVVLGVLRSEPGCAPEGQCPTCERPRPGTSR
ncbi:hypothetical protein NL108_009606 [Boleophthalmus pectinirostris]|nr:hypothetical protein NL108_009606 [Boleophthalmus pectinirostris]